MDSDLSEDEAIEKVIGRFKDETKAGKAVPVRGGSPQSPGKMAAVPVPTTAQLEVILVFTPKEACAHFAKKAEEEINSFQQVSYDTVKKKLLKALQLPKDLESVNFPKSPTDYDGFVESASEFYDKEELRHGYSTLRRLVISVLKILLVFKVHPFPVQGLSESALFVLGKCVVECF